MLRLQFADVALLLLGALIATTIGLTAVEVSAKCVEVPYAENYEFKENTDGTLAVYDADTGKFLANEGSCTLYEKQTK